jgi:hypothetical protein
MMKSKFLSASVRLKIPYPCKGEKIEGGHVVAAVGYDDKLKIKNTGKCGVETTGALLIRNSWGTGWGDGGSLRLCPEGPRRRLPVSSEAGMDRHWCISGIGGVGYG